MSDEQVWVKNTDENSTDLYMLSTNLDSSTEYDYYSKNDNDNIENLVNLTYINLPSIMNVLQTRYDKDNIYTFKGEILISINHFKTENIYNNNYGLLDYCDLDPNLSIGFYLKNMRDFIFLKKNLSKSFFFDFIHSSQKIKYKNLKVENEWNLIC